MRFTHPILFALASLALLACGDTGNTGTKPPVGENDRFDWAAPAALTAANSCESAHEALKAAAITQMELELDRTKQCFLGDGGCYRWLGGAEGDAANGPTPSSAPPKDDASPDEYSETNTQVE